jgi:hypothetical protein
MLATFPAGSAKSTFPMKRTTSNVLANLATNRVFDLFDEICSSYKPEVSNAPTGSSTYSVCLPPHPFATISVCRGQPAAPTKSRCSSVGRAVDL